MTTDTEQAARIAALQAKRAARPTKARRRPAEASRILVAGAGISAMLTLVTVMARADLAAAASAVNPGPTAAYTEPSSATATTVASGVVERATVPAPAQSVTVVRVATPQRVIGRSSGSR